MKRLLIVVLLVALLMSEPVDAADCTNPHGKEGLIIYNDDFDVMQFCAGDGSWISMAGGGGSDSDTLADLSCANDEIPKWNGASWACADDGGSDTLASLSCSAGEVPEWDGSDWVCGTGSGGGGTTGPWTDVTGSRAFGATYTNSTAGALAVAVTFRAAAAGNAVMWCAVDGVTIANTSTNAPNNGYGDQQFFIVPAGSTYGCTAGGGAGATMYSWTEMPLAGGGGSGSDTLAGLSCSANEIPKWNGTAWECAPDGNDGGASMTGAVMAFNASTCPTGWTEFTDARGRFLRGIDPTGTNDVVRAPGNTQDDELKSHTHPGGPWVTGSHGASGTGVYMNGSYGVRTGVGAAGGTETRPKNVAVIFCQYNGTGGLGGGGSGTQVAFSVHKNGTSQTITSTPSVLTWPTEAFDTNNDFASNRFTVSIAGHYLIHAATHCQNGSTFCQLELRKNGTTNVASGFDRASGGVANLSTVQYLVPGDYLEVLAAADGSTQVAYGGATYTHFDGYLLSGGGGSGGSSQWTTTGNDIYYNTGGVTIGGTTVADNTSVLDLRSTTKGFLPPRMTTAQRDAIASPAEGLVVYNTTTKSLDLRVASSWLSFGGNMTGNTMVSGWPDAIKCTRTSDSAVLIFNANFLPVGTLYRYRNIVNNGGDYTMDFNASGAWTASAVPSNCDNKTIAQLYASGQAYNFVGGATASADGTAGQVQFNEGGNLKADAALHWDNTNKRLGIGTAAPAEKLEVSAGSLRITRDLAGTDGGQLQIFNGNGTGLYLGQTGSGANDPSFIKTNASEDLHFHIGQAANSATPDVVFTSGGNVGIGTTTPTQRLDLGGGNISIGYERVSATCTGTTCNSVQANCTGTKYVIGGGCVMDNTNRYIWRSYPNGTNNWYCHAQNNLENAGSTITAYAICANVRP